MVVKQIAHVCSQSIRYGREQSPMMGMRHGIVDAQQHGSQ